MGEDYLNKHMVLDGTWIIKGKTFTTKDGKQRKLPPKTRIYVNKVLSNFKNNQFQLELYYNEEFKYDLVISKLNLDINSDTLTTTFIEELYNHLTQNYIVFE